MKLERLFLVNMLLFSGFGMAEARDVYVYNGTSATPVETVKNVTKITFAADGIVITGAGTEKKVALTAFDNITFYNRAIPEGIATVGSDGESIMLSGSQLTVNSKENIKSITLYNTAGQALTSYAPGTKVAKVVLAGYPDGVYLVKVKTAGKEVMRKIVKR